MYLCTYLCMNDCTLPVHLNSILHITSTLIWAIKCAVDLCIFVIFDAVNSWQSVHELHLCHHNHSKDPEQGEKIKLPQSEMISLL